MIIFSIIAAIMVIIAFSIILPPLFRKGFIVETHTEKNDTNVIIARERLQELKADFTAGKMEQREFDLAKSEIELNLAESLAYKNNSNLEPKHNRRLVLPLMILIPVIAVAVYQMTGTPIALDPEQLKAQQEMPDAEAMVAALAERLETNPADGEGWTILGRSYVAMGRFSEAEVAFSKAHEIIGDVPSLLADYADAIGRGNNNRDLTGAAKLLIEKSLSIDPQHPKSRWLAGMLAFQEKEYEKVTEYLEPLLSQTEPGTELHEGLKGLINEARSQSGQEPVIEQVTVSVSLTVNVSLAQTLKDAAGEDDTVYVFAKASQGPPIPLAVAKLTVKDLPATVKLNDAMAMRPDLKISMYEEVLISARVSKTGNAIATSGDYQASTVSIETSTIEPISLIINQLIP